MGIDFRIVEPDPVDIKVFTASSTSKTRLVMRFISASLLVLCCLPTRLDADWPQFRGPDGQGHSDAEGIPLRWSETESIVWKTPIPGEGWSSPVISGNQIWMTTATEKGKSLRAICVERKSGKLLHNVEVFRSEDPGPHHHSNGFASPSPVIEGDRVYIHFGPRGTACLDTKGEIIWKNTEFNFTLIQGAGSSPVLHGDTIILTCDGTDKQCVAALYKKTGKTKWKTPRTHQLEKTKSVSIAAMSYSTPLVIEVDGVPQLISTSADYVGAYDVETGKEIWWFQYEGFSLVARPSYGNGLVYVVGSVKLDHHAIYALRPGKGQILDKDLAWSRSVGIPHVPSPLLVGEEILLVHDTTGVGTCLNALTGEVHWKERLGGNYRASPLRVRGRIYFCNQEGKTFVLEAGKEFKTLATNKLDGTFFASPAVAGRALFLRSNTHLYRIER
jgi:outer membrane protein assembly factor BamB